jgi:hypothetical protein
VLAGQQQQPLLALTLAQLAQWFDVIAAMR